MIIKFIITVILVEAVTELIIKSKIFRRFRGWISRKNLCLRELLVCGYCFSFWAAVLIVPLMGIRLIFDNVLGIFVAIVVVHRISSHLHDATHIVVQHQKEKGV